MNRPSLLLLAVSIILPGASFAASCPLEEGMTVRRIVACKPEVTTDQCRDLASAEGCSVVRELESIHAIVIEVPEERVGLSESNLLARLEVAFVEKDPKINWLQAGFESVSMPSVSEFLGGGASLKVPPALPAAAVPNHLVVGPGRPDPILKSRDAPIPWGVARVNAPAAWSRAQGEGVKVAVIDTGIDVSHPDLKANVAGGVNILDNSSNFMDDQGHGTHVAGIIAGARGGGAAGVAPKARLYGVKVLDSSGSGNYDDIIAGIEWCAKKGIQVANMSLGAPEGSEALRLAVIAAARKGLTLVAAAGNTGEEVSFPAKYPEAIAVSASDSKDKLASFSSRGPEVAVVAPGSAIYSTYMGGGYKTLSGTSMAAPHVAGLAALAASLGAHGPAQVRKALQGAAQPLPGLTKEQQGAGMVDASKL